MRTLEVKEAHDALPYSTMATILRADYRRPPWNEDRMCGACKGPDDYGPQHTYGEHGPRHCPHCQCELVPFWSDERLERYLTTARLQPAFSFFAVHEDNELASWLWGYDTDRFRTITDGAPVFYIDVFAAAPAFRGAGWERSLRLFRHARTHIREGAFEKLPPIAARQDMPVYGSLFLWLMHRQWQRGYRCLATRTHHRAQQVTTLLRGWGFQPAVGILSDDPDREYWLNDMKSKSS